MDLDWESEAPEATAVVQMCDYFDARGMRRVYGRSDLMGRAYTFNLDIWKNKKGRLFMRCWSRYADVDPYSYEIEGVDVESIPDLNKECGFDDGWIPKEVRRAYKEWVEIPWF